jgi:hypothetical protein
MGKTRTLQERELFREEEPARTICFFVNLLVKEQAAMNVNFF